MLLIALAYLGGVLTIVSPCILPVLPFVFARADQPFVRSGLPLLAGMALTFALVASLAAVGGGWVVAANEYGRWLALALVALFALTLLWPGLSERLTRPLVALGSRLSERAQDVDGGVRSGGRPGAALLLGVATGLLWAPCAGPILGLILTGAALQGANTTSSLLLLAYAAGAATSMAAALLLGGKVFATLKRSLGAGEWVRRGLGAAMLAGVGAIALGLDTGVLARLSTASTGGLEQQLVDRLGGRPQAGAMQGPAMQGPAMMARADAGPAMMAAGSAMRTAAPAQASLPIEGPAPSLDGATDWLNSTPLTAEQLRGKVVLVDFWTYSCINCLRTLPYVKAWAEKYRDQGLVVVGVHAPEFAFERKLSNVQKAIQDLGITYPVAVDNGFKIWRAYGNQYWPAHYFIDAQGRIRHHHFGEGSYAESERVIQQLLQEAGARQVDQGLTEVRAQGVQQAADMAAVHSPETYLGYERAEHFASAPAAVHDRTTTYATPETLPLNAWGLTGSWKVGAESATLDGATGRISYRFQARDLHLVLGPSADGRPVRFRVLIDGQPPGADHGMDTAADGSGTVTAQRLYQLVRQSGDSAARNAERSFSIEFLDPGVFAYAFTFG
jgi:cytochrome c biogenesis protein CcdA/thiol-disulfide isomerase/thioredoxin